MKHVQCTLYINSSDDSCLECTPDELAGLVREIRDNSGIIGSHSYHLVNYKNTFVGRDLVTWLVQNKGYRSMWKIFAWGGWDTHICTHIADQVT